MDVPAVLIYGVVVYLFVGLSLAIAFYASGAERILGHHVSFTLGAKLMLLPGLVGLWPYIALRWLHSRGAHP